MDENGTYHYAGPTMGQQPKKPKKLGFNHAKLIILIILAAVLVLGATSCFYTVDDKQQLSLIHI